MYDVIIIGGGAGGMVAAITAARRGKNVLVLEKCDRLGKKLLATGNGKCNLGNLAPTEGKYNSAFVDAILSKYGLASERAFFESLGLLTREVEGRVYPYSEQASSVLNALRGELERLKVKVITGFTVTEIAAGYTVNGIYSAPKLVLATGSIAGFGSDGRGLVAKFGHTSREPKPALVPMLTAPVNLKGLRGVRVRAEVTLLADGRELAKTRDEVIFKDNGISGTAVFTLSQSLARAEDCGYARLVLDFMPEYSTEEAEKIIGRLGGIEGLLHKELVANVQRIAEGRGITLAEVIKNYPLENARPGSPELAQVMSGGLATAEFDCHTLESKKSPGLYALGEVLDVDGECGGYNLMWAYASGTAVGENV